MTTVGPNPETELSEKVKDIIFNGIMEKYGYAAFYTTIDAVSMSDSTSPKHFSYTRSRKISTTKADNLTTNLDDTRDGSPTTAIIKTFDASPHVHDDAERQDASPVINIKTIKSEYEEFAEVLEHEDEEIACRVGTLPIRDKIGKELEILDEVQETQNIYPPTIVKSFDFSEASLFDTDSEEVEETEGELTDLSMLLHRDGLILIKTSETTTATESFLDSPPNKRKLFCTQCSLKPFFMSETQEFDEVQAALLDQQVEEVYRQRLKAKAAQRSFIAKLAIKFEGAVMAVCGQQEEVLFVIERGPKDTEELVETSDSQDTPVQERAKEVDLSIGMVGLLSTTRISGLGKLSPKDRALAPVYENAVYNLESLENQIIRKARAIELGKKSLESFSCSSDKMRAATNLAFLEVELRETQRKVVLGRESLRRLYEAFSPKTQKAIDNLQMDFATL